MSMPPPRALNQTTVRKLPQSIQRQDHQVRGELSKTTVPRRSQGYPSALPENSEDGRRPNPIPGNLRSWKTSAGTLYRAHQEVRTGRGGTAVAHTVLHRLTNTRGVRKWTIGQPTAPSRVAFGPLTFGILCTVATGAHMTN
ncbi:unnamed protein product [Prunus brigantina]